jgi:hypothetical protein
MQSLANDDEGLCRNAHLNIWHKKNAEISKVTVLKKQGLFWVCQEPSICQFQSENGKEIILEYLLIIYNHIDTPFNSISKASNL